MDEQILRDEESVSLYGHDTHSILSASTSSRVTLTGPRQRPKGPRTSDVSRSSTLERTTLPLSPLAKEISTVSEESSASTKNKNDSSGGNNLGTLSPTSPPPRRTSLVARFSFRRSWSRSHHEPEGMFADDPFRATPHPSVRWDASSAQEPVPVKLLNNQDVKLPTQSSERFSLTTESSPETLVPLRPKRSFFRRMADKFMRAHYAPSSGFSSSEIQAESVKNHHRVKQPITYLSSQLPTPSSPSFSSPLPFVSRVGDSSSVQSHENTSRTLPSLKLPDTVTVRTLPVLSADGGTVSSLTFGESASSPKISSPSESLYHTHSVSPSWQPMTPISPSRENHASVGNAIGNPMHSFHTPLSYNSLPTSGDVSTQYANRKAVSIRSIPIKRDTSVLEKRSKAMSLRSQRVDPSSSFKSSAQTPREGGNRALVDLDKAMFEKELARERESKSPREDKLARVKKSASYAARTQAIEPTTSPTNQESKRHLDTSKMDRRNFHSYKPLPRKPSSAPNPSTSAPQRGLAFSFNLDTSSDVHIPLSPVSIARFPPAEIDRLYPDVLYTASESGGHLFPLSGNNLSTRSLRTQRSPRSSPEKADGHLSRTYIANGHDKVSRWLASTSRSDDLDDSTYPSSVAKMHSTSTELNELVEETVFKHKDKGKGRAF